MKTTLQVFIDKWFGAVLNILLYVPVRILGLMLRMDHRLDKDFKRIAVAKYKGMGSIVQASALLQTLRNNYPDAKIIFISTQANKGILSFYTKELNSSILINDRGFIALAKSSINALIQLWKFRPELYIDLEVYSNFSTLMCTLSAAKNRLGYYKSDKDYRTGMYTHLMYYNIKAPLSGIYLQMARLTGKQDIIETLICPHVSDELKSKTKATCEKLGFEMDKAIIINPNASDLRLERRWPIAQFIELISLLRQSYPDKTLLLIGSPNERAYVEKISMHFQSDNRVVNTAGAFLLDELISVLNESTVIITNDTGPLHLALSLKKSVVGLFGPCSPKQYGQMETCIPIYKNMYCSPCVHEFIQPPCHGNNQCMKQIVAQDVLNAITKAIHQNHVLSADHVAYQTEGKALGYILNR